MKSEGGAIVPRTRGGRRLLGGLAEGVLLASEITQC